MESDCLYSTPIVHNPFNRSGSYIGPPLTIGNYGCGLSPQMLKVKHHENEPTKKK